MRTVDRRKKVLEAALAACALAIAAPGWGDDWRWSITPYVWGISANMDTSLDIPEGGVEQRFSDIIDKLDFAAQIHLEGHKGRHGFLLDVTNLQLSDRITRGPLELDTDSSTTLVEGAMLFGLAGEAAPTELMVGLRVLDVNFDIEIEGTGGLGFIREASMNSTPTDVLLGVRHLRPLSERWDLRLRADVASGGTDFSWSVSGMLGRSVGERGMLVFGYRYLDVDFGDQQDLVDPQLVINGPAIGYSFRF